RGGRPGNRWHGDQGDKRQSYSVYQATSPRLATHMSATRLASVKSWTMLQCKSGERHMRFHGLNRHAATLCIAAALAAQPAAAKVISVSAETPDANEKLQEALILAEPGDTVQLGAGTWKLA